MTLDNSLINDTFMYSYTMDYNNTLTTIPATSCYNLDNNNLVSTKSVSPSFRNLKKYIILFTGEVT